MAFDEDEQAVGSFAIGGPIDLGVDGEDPTPGRASEFGAPAVAAVPNPVTPGAVAEATTGSFAAKLKAQIEAAQSQTKTFEIPTTVESPQVRLFVKVKALKNQSNLHEAAKTDPRFIDSVTVAVFGQDADGPLEEIPGAWAGVGRMMAMPSQWKPHRAVLLACENNPLLLGSLASEIIDWMRGQRTSAESDLG